MGVRRKASAWGFAQAAYACREEGIAGGSVNWASAAFRVEANQPSDRLGEVSEEIWVLNVLVNIIGVGLGY